VVNTAPSALERQQNPGKEHKAISRLDSASAAKWLASHPHMTVPFATVGAGDPGLLAYAHPFHSTALFACRGALLAVEVAHGLMGYWLPAGPGCDRHPRPKRKYTWRKDPAEVSAACRVAAHTLVEDEGQMVPAYRKAGRKAGRRHICA
jgi:hypothetical protein